MRRLATEILKKHDSYIDALKESVDKWELAKTETEKRDYIIVIGEIGNEIHRQNRMLNIAKMQTID